GDVLAVARIAGITAVKRTADLIPLAHAAVAVESCTVDLELAAPGDNPQPRIFTDGGNAEAPTKAFVEELMRQPLPPHGGLRIRVRVESSGKTGVEMEALCGVAGAALSVVDMCKAVDKHLVVDGVSVAGKKGGKSGSWGVIADEEDEEEGNRRFKAAREEDFSSYQHQGQEPSTETNTPAASSTPPQPTPPQPREEARTYAVRLRLFLLLLLLLLLLIIMLGGGRGFKGEMTRGGARGFKGITEKKGEEKEGKEEEIKEKEEERGEKKVQIKKIKTGKGSVMRAEE
ncbi:MAG: hypothetical protein LQ348_004736, partial [Seirophora lacunosa]